METDLNRSEYFLMTNTEYQYIHDFRLGFVAEAHPRFIVPTEVEVGGEDKSPFCYESQTELYDQFVDFIQNLFFK